MEGDDDVRYLASAEPSDGQEPLPEAAADGTCSLCGTVGPRLPRTVPQVPRAAYAFAGTWLLCGACDVLAESGDAAALLDRIRLVDLTADRARELAGLLTGSPER